jgi:hypothetical protein
MPEGVLPLAGPSQAIQSFRTGKGMTGVVSAVIRVHPNRTPIGVFLKVHVYQMYLSWLVSVQFSKLCDIFHIQRASSLFLHIDQIVERTECCLDSRRYLHF